MAALSQGDDSAVERGKINIVACSGCRCLGTTARSIADIVQAFMPTFCRGFGLLVYDRTAPADLAAARSGFMSSPARPDQATHRPVWPPPSDRFHVLP